MQPNSEDVVVYKVNLTEEEVRMWFPEAHRLSDAEKKLRLEKILKHNMRTLAQYGSQFVNDFTDEQKRILGLTHEEDERSSEEEQADT